MSAFNPTGTEANAPALYLSGNDIAQLGVEAAAVLDAVTEVLLSTSRGSAAQGLKTTIDVGGGGYFQALPSVLRDQGMACVKWVSVLPVGDGPSIHATLLLNSVQSGRLLAVLDGTWITAVRTAAMSAIAARALARPGSSVAGFVGCGVQAESHLNMLRQVLPKLNSVAAYSRSQQSAERFCIHARSLGIEAVPVSSPRDAVSGQDVVVSSVSASGISKPFLDASWLDSGAFVAMVDMGRSWIASSLLSVEVVATDDRAQSSILASQGKLSHPGPYAFSLDELAAGKMEDLDARGRRVFIFGGMGACDVAVAALCYRHALTHRDVGTPLPPVVTPKNN